MNQPSSPFSTKYFNYQTQLNPHLNHGLKSATKWLTVDSGCQGVTFLKPHVFVGDLISFFCFLLILFLPFFLPFVFVDNFISLHG